MENSGKSERKRILGLDTGTNSLGWAIVEQKEDGTYSLQDRGVVIFKEGVKIEKGVESSKAADRTAHRALRRQYFRRRLRKIEVLKVLVRYDLCPALTDEDLHLWHTRKIYPRKDEFMQWQRTNDADGTNPYYSRYVCLHETLDLNRQADRYTLGRALYHLAQRRGFQSNRLDTTEDSEQGKVNTGIAELTKEMNEAGCQYLGEYFYKVYSEKGNTVRIRTRYVDRGQHYKAEFRAICERQNLPQEMREALDAALYFQRPLKSQRQSVGKCTLEKTKARCSDSHPLYEEFRMLQFLNNVKILTPYDMDGKLRPLNDVEREKVMPLFYRKSKPNFDFEDIAKKIAGPRNYQWVGDTSVEKGYKFNYRMTQGVGGCPTTAQLRDVFGPDWVAGIAEVYDLNTHRDGTPKTAEEMACDIWNVLYFFDSKECLKDYGTRHLQLSEELAERFSNIRMSHNFGSLSLKAIRAMLPFLRQGLIYSHAVFAAKIPELVGSDVWADEVQRQDILAEIDHIISTRPMEENGADTPADQRIKEYLAAKFGVDYDRLQTLYHPSQIDTGYSTVMDKSCREVLGSPKTNSVRNPMAMRSLHEVRRLVNTLIREGKVDHSTEVHIEYAHSLNDANMRAAINDSQREQEKKHKESVVEIKKLYKEATGRDIEPTPDDILKFSLWVEQDRHCLYTGKSIGIADFLGEGPTFDIEHTIPQSRGGDSTRENMTLCDSHYNRFVKKAQLPTELAGHEQLLVRIQPWKDREKDLTRQIDKLGTHGIWDKAAKDRIIRKRHRLKMERDYWRRKYERFTMTNVPEGFALRQGAGIGLISRYAGYFLKSYFCDSSDKSHRQVFSVKGAVTAEFRRMWGLQDEYEKKSRASHTHHCIDAIVIACIGKNEINRMGEFYHAEEECKAGRGAKPSFKKPWPTFTQDIKSLVDEILVVHDTTDNMPKKASRRMLTKQGIVVAQGDSARAALHQDTYYGAIKCDGEVRYVVRRPLSSFASAKDLDNIVDDGVRQVILRAVEELGFAKAMQGPIYMNREKGILINKVRCFANSVKNPLHIRHHRDQSTCDYKQRFHVMNDANYCMAIYEGEVKGKPKRDFEIVSTMDAASYYKRSSLDGRAYPMVPEKSTRDFPIKYLLYKGTHVLLYEKTPQELFSLDSAQLSKRLYVVSGLGLDKRPDCSFGVLNLLHHTEARPSSEVPLKKGAYKLDELFRPKISMLHTQFHALVEGRDFVILPTGEIRYKKTEC